MTKANITQYSSTASSNQDIDDINIDENCPASGLNNALRSLMAHLKNVDTGTQALTALSVTGETTLASHLNMGDNDKIKLGASADLQIYHDATNNLSIIEDVGSGILAIKGSTNIDFVNAENTKYYARFVNDSSVSLFHNGTQKFETTSSGVTVSGNLSVTGSGSDMVLIHTTTVSSAVGSVVIDGQFSSTYKNYKLVASNVQISGNGANMNLHFYRSGSKLTGSNHRSIIIEAKNGDSSISPFDEGGDTEFSKVGGHTINSASDKSTNIEIMFYEPLSTNNTKMFTAKSTNIDTGGNTILLLSSGQYLDGNTALSGFEIDPSGGNIDSGTFKLYGLK